MLQRLSRLLVLVLGVVTIATTSVHHVTSQWTNGRTVKSLMRPATSNTTSTLSGSGSFGATFRPDSSSDSSRDENDSETSDSGSWSMESGSGSRSAEYGCDCRSVRRVSLMGASDYCLAPGALLSSKCGNVELGESGSCPLTGAQPCSVQGHILANNSLCALDKKDDTYKCVASKNDLEIQKHGKKKRNNSSRRREPESSMSTASSYLLLTARQVLAIAVCVAAGVIAVV